MRRILGGLPWLFIFPYLVGFAPPDSDGTFFSFSGGKGAYPSASCSQSFRHEYKEAAVNIDHRVPMGGKGNFITFGVFGEKGVDRKILVHDDDDTGLGRSTTSEMNALGAHVGFDWRWVGIDLGAVNLKLPGENGMQVLPQGGLRFGPPGFYVSSSFLAGRPLFSDGALLNMGMGTHFGATQVWAGMGAGPFIESEVGILRIRHDFGPFALGVTAQGNPNSGSVYSPGLVNNFGMSGRLEFRLP